VRRDQSAISIEDKQRLVSAKPFAVHVPFLGEVRHVGQHEIRVVAESLVTQVQQLLVDAETVNSKIDDFNVRKVRLKKCGVMLLDRNTPTKRVRVTQEYDPKHSLRLLVGRFAISQTLGVDDVLNGVASPRRHA
jgi:hypothetical protein